MGSVHFIGAPTVLLHAEQFKMVCFIRIKVNISFGDTAYCHWVISQIKETYLPMKPLFTIEILRKNDKKCVVTQKINIYGIDHIND